jgi:hypothetical protein
MAAYCPTVVAWAKNHGLWHPGKTGIQAGDMVLFDWGGDGTPDHVGLVVGVTGTTISTVEGNTATQDPYVRARTRTSGILGYARLPLDGTATIPTPATDGKLVVDGEFGPNSTHRLQHVLGLTTDEIFGPDTARALQTRVGAPYRDGTFDRVNPTLVHQHWPTWMPTIYTAGTTGSPSWKAVQAWIGTPRDGIPGKQDAKALQTTLNTL